MSYDFSRLSILIVDDSAYMRYILKTILQGLGFRQIHEANDGADGLRIIKSATIDIALVDWEMTPLDGLDFVRLIRTGKDSRSPMLPVIMVSGHSEPRRVMEARDAGVNEFLVKPVSARALYLRIVSVIEKPRPYIRTRTFFGPDRRRRMSDSWNGNPKRDYDLYETAGNMTQDAVDAIMHTPARDGDVYGRSDMIDAAVSSSSVHESDHRKNA